MRLANSVSCLQAKTEGMNVPGRCRRERIPFRLAQPTIHLSCPLALEESPAWLALQRGVVVVKYAPVVAVVAFYRSFMDLGISIDLKQTASVLRML